MKDTAISLKKITKIFTTNHAERLVALSNINLEIAKGEIFIFLGPSGSGKSTLLRIMSGLDKQYLGEVKIAPDISRFDFSFVFQNFALLPWLSVRENIGLGLIARGRPREEINKRVNEELERFGLAKFADSHIRELSGGMKQRVGIARALATDPKIIFLDEPFSELDSFTARELRTDLLRIWRERKPTIIMVSHMIDEALELADRIGVLTPRPGRIESIVVNPLPLPREKRSSEFFALEDELYKLVKP